MAPVILTLKKQTWVDTKVIVTAQHRGMLDQMLLLFGIKPDVDLNVMAHNQSLSELSAKLLNQLDAIYREQCPELVIAQGDTTTTLIAALAAFYLNISFCHIEAGLRSFNLRQPFPEEMNRVLIARLTAIHCVPTLNNKNNLLAEGIDQHAVFITGNTVIDALYFMAAQPIKPTFSFDSNKRLILVTCHRRESFGEPIQALCLALKQLVQAFGDIQILFPVHPNPNVSTTVHQELADIENIILVAPLDYTDFIAALTQAYLVLTDSGGVQEEAPALGKPVLVLRETTERIESITAGVAKLVPMITDAIFTETAQLLADHNKYQQMAKKVSPYGDGSAAKHIAAIIKKHLTSD